ncbi:MAG: phosphohydrolase [Deltaproteobacteria bacterium]|nr:HD domain-containing protein [Deltaproteobacteria bacterium]RLA91534.1 MAG: phosphohydrolase [Deltaproteobacteria bacterium]
MKCPGQDTRYWKHDAIFEVKCPKCGYPVEFFKDETTKRCKSCGYRFTNPRMDFGCASYCPQAKQCLGELPPELIEKRKELLKDRVAIEMKRYFGKDFKRIGHATRVARYAEEISKNEGGNIAVILIAAYLHDIGIKEAEKKYKEDYEKYHEEEGAHVAYDILTRLGADKELIEEVIDIISHHHHPKDNENINFEIVYDADLVVNLEEKLKESKIDEKNLKEIINNSFFTETGLFLAKKNLLENYNK